MARLVVLVVGTRKADQRYEFVGPFQSIEEAMSFGRETFPGISITAQEMVEPSDALTISKVKAFN